MADQPGYEDAWESREGREFIADVLSGPAPQIKGSALVTSLIPKEGDGDVKFWVELGASIMMNKPMMGIALSGQKLPPKLEQVMDRIVRFNNMAEVEDRRGQERIMKAINELVPDGD